MNNKHLEDLYRATEEDMQFALGLLELPGLQPRPYIHFHYRHWTREMLEVVRESFTDGLILESGKRKQGQHDLFLSTCERIVLQAKENGHTSVLRAPAWDACLADVDGAAVERFEANRAHCGSFVLLVQTLAWEFLTTVHDLRGTAVTGPIQRRVMPVPMPGAGPSGPVRQKWEGER